MKKFIYFFLFFLVSLAANSQVQRPAGNPSPNSPTGYSLYGWSRADSGYIWKQRDTFPAKFPTIIWHTNGNFYKSNGNGGAWSLFASSTAGTVSSVSGNAPISVANGTTTPTISADTSYNGLATKKWLYKTVDSLGFIKLNISDTAAMLLTRLKVSDTAYMLSAYLRKSDTSAMLSNYVPISRTITTNAPLFGGGSLASNRTFGVDTGRANAQLVTGGSLTAVKDTLIDLIASSGGGTVLSVSTTDGYGVISSVANASSTPNISLRVDTLSISTRDWRQKGIDSVQANLTAGLALKLNLSDTAAMLSNRLKISDTASMLLPFVQYSDTSNMLSPYRRTTTKIQNSDLANSTISGVSLGGTLNALTFGQYLQVGASSYDGSVARTITTNATSTNVGSTLVARDINGDFTARNISASLIGNASSASTVAITNDISTNATYYPMFSTVTTGSTSTRVSSSKLTYNPSTGALSSTGFIGNLTGNASTATVLQTPRTINGVAFDGSANISISASVDSSLSAGYGIIGSPFDGSLGRTWIIDTSVISTKDNVDARLLGYVDLSNPQSIDGLKTFNNFIRTVTSGSTGLQAYNTERGYFVGMITGSSDSLFVINYDSGYSQAKTRIIEAKKTGEVRIPTMLNGSSSDSVLVSNNGEIRKVLQSSIGSGSYLPLSGGTLTGALNGTSIALSQDITINNGKFFQAKRNTGGVMVNILGFESGTDDLIQVTSDTFKLRNTGTGDAANLITVANNGNTNIVGSVTANSIVKSGGTSLQFLKADGSVDNNTYLTSADISGKLNISDTATMLSNYRRKTTLIENSDLRNSAITINGSSTSLGSSISVGTVTSVATNTGSGITGGTITSSGTLAIDTSIISTKANVTGLLVGYATIASLSAYLPLSGGTLTGALSGTSISLSGNITLNNGQFFQAKRNTGGAIVNVLGFESGTDKLIQVTSDTFKLRNTGVGDAANLITVSTSGNTNVTGSLTANSIVKLGGTSTQFLKADGSVDNNTYLTSADIAGKLNISDTATMLSNYRRKTTLIENADLRNSAITINGSSTSLGDSISVGTVTNVSAGTGMSFTTITSSGAVNADTTVLATRAYAAGLDVGKANTSLNNVNGVLSSTYGGAGSVSGILKANGSGVVSAAVAGTDYVVPSALSGYLPLSGGTLTGALSGTSLSMSGNVNALKGDFGQAFTTSNVLQAFSSSATDASMFQVGMVGVSNGFVLKREASVFKMEWAGQASFGGEISGTSLSMSGIGLFNGATDDGTNKLIVNGGVKGGAFEVGTTLTLKGTNTTNNTETAFQYFRDGSGNELGAIIGNRGADGNAGSLRFYTNNFHTLALTLDNTSSATFSSSVTATNATLTNSTASTSTTTGALIVTGGVGVGGAIWAGSGFFESDLRWKKINNRIASNTGIDAIRWTWNETHRIDERQHWGYSAQDVLKVLPEAVSKTKEGFYGVEYNSVFSYKIANLEKIVSELEQKLEKLERELKTNSKKAKTKN